MNLDLRLSPLSYQAHHREDHILPEGLRMDLKFQLLAEVPLDPKEQSALGLVQKLPELQVCSMQLWSNYRHRHNRLTLQRQSRCRKPIL